MLEGAIASLDFLKNRPGIRGLRLTDHITSCRIARKYFASTCPNDWHSMHSFWNNLRLSEFMWS